MSRSYPTDALIALAHLAESLERTGPRGPNGVTGESLRSYLTAPGLRHAADIAVGGLLQWPWSPLLDEPAVIRFRPVGRVRVHGEDVAAVLRGLIFALLTGNDVVLSDDEEGTWSWVVDTLRAVEIPIPEVRVLSEHEKADDPSYPTLSVPTGSGTPDHVLALDARSPWVTGLSARELLARTTLIRARAEDRAEERDRMAARVRFLVHEARRSPVYADLPATVTALGDLPVLEREDLVKASFPTSADLLPAGAERAGEVLRSGGSSGLPRYVVYSRDDWDNMVREAVHMFYELGLEPGDRVVNTLFGGGMYGGLLTSVCELSRMPVENYAVAQSVQAEDLVTLAGPTVGANTLLAQPALIMPLLRKALSLGLGPGLRKVLYGGTPMSESDKQWLRESVGVERIASILAANDGAQIGFQCSHLTGTRHHICNDFNLVEIIDDAGDPRPLGSHGDIAITTLTKLDGPLVRYRIGDFGRLLPHDCPCGLPGPVLEFAGRSDGLVKIMGRRFTMTALLDALDAFGISITQVVITATGEAEQVTVRVESARELAATAVEEHLRTHFPPFADRNDFDAGLDVFGFKVEVYAAGQLERDPVSGKVRPVLDARF